MTDSRELAHHNGAQRQVRQSDNLLAQVIAAAKDPNIDAQKMETLARLVNTQQDREREIEFNQSKNAAIMEMPVITKDGRIIIPANRDKGTPERQQGRFAKWEDIDRVVRPILARHNLAMSFDMTERQGGGITVTPILSHTNGYTQRGGGFPVPPDQSGSKNAAQAMGSSASYGKRYAGCAMLNIVTEGVDDDGNRGQGLNVSLPFEREQVVVEDAQKAFDEGRYLEWFAKQSPKDRAWLVTTAKHIEFGGQPRIDPPKKPAPEQRQREERAPVQDLPRDDEPPPQTEETRQPTGKRTPQQMVEDFKVKLGAAQTKKEVVDLQEDPKIAKWMSDLEERYPQLHQSVVDYAATRYADLSAKERESARGGGGTLV